MTAERALVCGGCDRELEVCALCETEDCKEATCYRCLIIELGEFLAQPHEHGG